MSIIGNSYLNLIDVLSRSDNGKLAAKIVELLHQRNRILEDAHAIECNMGTKHRHTIRTGLPSVSWGALYQGVKQSKSTTMQVDDTTGWVEALSSVDKRLLDIAPDPRAIRLSEATPFLEAMSQEMATGFFYHDTKDDPKKIKGLGARYGALTGGGAAGQVVDGGGLGSDNTSVWFVTWGDQFTHLLYPQGTQAGIKREDKGEQRVTDENGNPYFVLEEMFNWHLGVAVKDWRYNARVCNIDISELRAGTVDLYKLMRAAYYRLQSRGMDASVGKQAIYCNREVLEALDAQPIGGGTADNRVRLTPKEVEGKEVLTYRGIPIREVDALLNTEARVV